MCFVTMYHTIVKHASQRRMQSARLGVGAQKVKQRARGQVTHTNQGKHQQITCHVLVAIRLTGVCVVTEPDSNAVFHH